MRKLLALTLLLAALGLTACEKRIEDARAPDDARLAAAQRAAGQPASIAFASPTSGTLCRG